jgi:polysaccharide export outer membrane protein
MRFAILQFIPAATLVFWSSVAVSQTPERLASPPENKGSAARTPETDPANLAKPTGAPAQAAVPVDSNTYVIGAEDVLNVQVWHEAELTRTVIVQPDGKISLNLVNELTAAGLTPIQLAATIRDGLKKYIVNPEVNVSVQQVNSKKYFIQGEVLKPGSYPLVVPTTIMEGLVNAGGFRDFANLTKITILRGKQILKFNYKEVRSGKHLEQNILLQPGDQIFVK